MPRTCFTNWLTRGLFGRAAKLESPTRRRPYRTFLRFDELENRITPAPIPTVALGGSPDGQPVPANVLIGEVANLSVTFDNIGSTTGYGPYIDLFLPRTGSGGPSNNSQPDGIHFLVLSATCLGTPVQATTSQLGLSTISHPIAQTSSAVPLQIPKPAGFFVGDQLVVLELPFGSFTPGQPAVTVRFDVMVSSYADVNQPLSIQARGGFRFGQTPADDPLADPSISSSVFDIETTTPSLFTLTKKYLGAENETATGPNFPHQYQIKVNVATGQTINNMIVTDNLSNSMQFVSLDSVTGTSGTIAYNTAIGNFPSTIFPGGNLLVKLLPSVVGTSALVDVDVKFSFYIPRNHLSGAVIDATTGDDTLSTDDAKVEGDWAPLDPLDLPSPMHVVSDVTAIDHKLTDKSIAVQKTVFDVTTGSAVKDEHYLVSSPGSPRPGDILRYTIHFQISDYFAFKDVNLADVLSDGQLFLNGVGTAPTFTFTRGGATTATTTGTFITGNVVPTGPNPVTGRTNVKFRVSNELIGRGFNPAGQMIGAGVADAGGYQTSVVGPGTTGTVVFYAKIREDYVGNFHKPIAPFLKDKSVDHGDLLTNDVSIFGEVLQVGAGFPSNVPQQFEDDGSHTDLILPNGVLTKSIYAVNGTLVSGPVSVATGDLVTFRLNYFLPHSDSDRLIITDYLPKPVFSTSLFPVGANTFTPQGAVPPPVNRAQFGPNDTLHLGFVGQVPLVTPSFANNSLSFNFNYQSNAAYTTLTRGSFDDALDTPRLIDILFTVKVSTSPFADGLFITNIVHSEERSTNNASQNVSGFGSDIVAQNAIVQLTLTEPVLNIRKGAVATNHPNGVFTNHLTGLVASPAPTGITVSPPGSAGFRFSSGLNSTNLPATLLRDPANTNLRNVDAADFVTFAIVLENTGTGLNGAFNVKIKDTIPAGFHVPAPGNLLGLKLRVSNGNGIPLGYALTTTPAAFAPFTTSFTISLLDSPGAGAIRPYHPTNGKNIAVITYDLQVNKVPPALPQPSVHPLDALTNTATLIRYTASSVNTPGSNFVPNGVPDTATATIAPLALRKRLLTTEIVNAHNGQYRAVIGERAQYSLTLRVPEGITTGATIVDTMAPGMAYVMFPPAGPNLFGPPPLTTITTSSGVTLTTGFFVTKNAAGTMVIFHLGTIKNSNINNSFGETITIRYWAQVLNVVGNQFPSHLANSAVASWTGHTLAAVTDPVHDVLVIEPQLTVVKTATPNQIDVQGYTTFVITVTNLGTTTPASHADAYNVTLSDVIPAGFAYYVPGGLTPIVGPNLIAPMLAISAGNTVATASWAYFPLGKSSSFYFSARLKPAVTPCTVLTNYAKARWTSLPGSPGVRLPYNLNSRERTGADGVGGALNDYAFRGSAVVHVNGSDICGKVYCDANNNGVFNPGEDGIAGVTLKLTGNDIFGNVVNMTVMTDASGNYCFLCLPPSDTVGYTVTEIQPPATLEGHDQAGTPFGGNAMVQNVISHIVIPPGSNVTGTGYNFGELHPPSICGFVYVDGDNDGVKDPGEVGIAGVTIKLTGTNDLGQPVSLSLVTAFDGSYCFLGLRPSNSLGYDLTQKQPPLFVDGKDTAGTAGGLVGPLGTSFIHEIVVSWCEQTVDNNFGEH